MKNVLTTAIVASTLAFAGAASAAPFDSDIFTQKNNPERSVTAVASSNSAPQAPALENGNIAGNAINGTLPRD